MFRRLICVMMVTAFRLGEVVRHHSKLTTLLQRGLQNPQWLVSYRTPCLTLTEPPADPFCPVRSSPSSCLRFLTF